MAGSWRWIGWIAFVAVVIILIFASMPDTGLREGHKGSYLGRVVADTQGSGDQAALNGRVARQRY